MTEALNNLKEPALSPELDSISSEHSVNPDAPLIDEENPVINEENKQATESRCREECTFNRIFRFFLILGIFGATVAVAALGFKVNFFLALGYALWLVLILTGFIIVPSIYIDAQHPLKSYLREYIIAITVNIVCAPLLLFTTLEEYVLADPTPWIGPPIDVIAISVMILLLRGLTLIMRALRKRCIA